MAYSFIQLVMFIVPYIGLDRHLAHHAGPGAGHLQRLQGRRRRPGRVR